MSWSTPTFNQPLQQQQQNAIDPNQALYNAVFNCQVFGDERDRTLSRWNLVQALWGTGKGSYNFLNIILSLIISNLVKKFNKKIFNENILV